MAVLYGILCKYKVKLVPVSKWLQVRVKHGSDIVKWKLE